MKFVGPKDINEMNKDIEVLAMNIMVAKKVAKVKRVIRPQAGGFTEEELRYFNTHGFKATKTVIYEIPKLEIEIDELIRVFSLIYYRNYIGEIATYVKHIEPSTAEMLEELGYEVICDNTWVRWCEK